MQNNIRRLRKGRGWTMQELADRIDGEPKPHFTTIAKLERNQRGLSVDWIEKLAKALGVAPEEVISDEAARPRMVPMLGRIPAGGWQEAVQDAECFVLAPPGGPNVFGLRPQGDSMNEVILPGAYVLVDPDQPELVDGRIYAIRNASGDATLKMFRSDPPRLEPRSSNPAHQPILFGREPFTVIGRVVWQGQEL